MKNPLTSKERRGLAAVAAAALLCVGMGFLFRSCSGGGVGDSVRVNSEEVRVVGEDGNDKAKKGKNGAKSQKVKKGRKGKKKKEKAEKVIPVRDPLSQPCD